MRDGLKRRSTRHSSPLIVAAAALMVAVVEPKPVAACPFGRRVRLFPLGTADQEIVVAEINESRASLPYYSEAPFDAPNLYWVGYLRLLRVTAAGHVKPGEISLGQTVSRAIYYYLDTRRALARALERARRIPGFKIFSHPKLVPCTLDGRCGPARVVAKGAQVWLELAGARGRLLAASHVAPMSRTVESVQDKRLRPEDYARQLTPAYLLSYRWETRRVFVAPLSSGIAIQFFAPVGWRPRTCRSVQTCIPPAAIPDHQISRDGLAVLPDRSVAHQGRVQGVR